MLPSQYQRVEFIGTTGTQHIDTGCKPNNTTRLKMRFSFVTVPSTNAVFGSRNSTTDKNFNLWATANTFNPQYNGNDWGSNPVSCSITTSTVFDIDFNRNVFSYLSSTGESGSTTLSNTGTFKGDYPILLSAVNSAGSKDYRITSIKIYSCLIYDNGALVRNFVPCYRVSDNVIGLYDTVNGVFYTNAGSGTFTKGSNVAEEVITYRTVIHKAIQGFNDIQENLPEPSLFGIGTPGSTGSNSTPAAISAAISKCAVIKLGTETFRTGKVNVYDPSVDS